MICPAPGPGPELCQAARLRTIYYNRLRNLGGAGLEGSRLPLFPQACPPEQREQLIRYSGRPCLMCFDVARDQWEAERRAWRQRVVVEQGRGLRGRERERERDRGMESVRERDGRRVEMEIERQGQRQRQRARIEERPWHRGMGSDERAYEMMNGGEYGCGYSAGNGRWPGGRRGCVVGEEGGYVRSGRSNRRPIPDPDTDLRRWMLQRVLREAVHARRRERQRVGMAMAMAM